MNRAVVSGRHNGFAKRHFYGSRHVGDQISRSQKTLSSHLNMLCLGKKFFMAFSWTPNTVYNITTLELSLNNIK